MTNDFLDILNELEGKGKLSTEKKVEMIAEWKGFQEGLKEWEEIREKGGRSIKEIENLIALKLLDEKEQRDPTQVCLLCSWRPSPNMTTPEDHKRGRNHWIIHRDVGSSRQWAVAGILHSI